MQLLETNGIDLQLPKEEPKYDVPRLRELILEYLEYHKYELRDDFFCEYIRKEVQWFCDEYADRTYIVKVWLNGVNTLFTELKTETGQMVFVSGRLTIGSSKNS